jgi:hypothetical protein
MTKDELIALLQNDGMPGDTPVVLFQPTHDYWGNTKAGTIVELDETTMVHSDYHDCNVLVDEDDITHDEDDGMTTESGKPVTRCLVLR